MHRGMEEKIGRRWTGGVLSTRGRDTMDPMPAVTSPRAHSLALATSPTNEQKCKRQRGQRAVNIGSCPGPAKPPCLQTRCQARFPIGSRVAWQVSANQRAHTSTLLLCWLLLLFVCCLAMAQSLLSPGILPDSLPTLCQSLCLDQSFRHGCRLHQPCRCHLAVYPAGSLEATGSLFRSTLHVV